MTSDDIGLPQSPAQTAEGEPVAWRVRFPGGNDGWKLTYAPDRYGADWEKVPLYSGDPAVPRVPAQAAEDAWSNVPMPQNIHELAALFARLVPKLLPEMVDAGIFKASMSVNLDDAPEADRRKLAEALAEGLGCRLVDAEGSGTIAAAQKQAVPEVRKLEWKEPTSGPDEYLTVAQAGGFSERYEIEPSFGTLPTRKWRVKRSCDLNPFAWAGTKEDAKAAAQADFERRAFFLPQSSFPEDQQKATATPTIADPDGEARS